MSYTEGLCQTLFILAVLFCNEWMVFFEQLLKQENCWEGCVEYAFIGITLLPCVFPLMISDLSQSFQICQATVQFVGAGIPERITAWSSIWYFRFLRGGESRQQWLNACRRNDDLNPVYVAVCSIHFTPHDYKDDLKYHCLGTERPVREQALKEGATISLFLHYSMLSDNMLLGQG